MISKVKEKGAGWKRVSKVNQRVSKMHQRIRTEKRHSHKIEIWRFLATWSIWHPIGAPTGFWRVFKSTVFDENQHRITIKGLKAGVLNKHDFRMDFWCQDGRPWEAKTSISRYTCCNLRGFAGSWDLIQNAVKKIIHNHPTSEPRAPKGLIFLIWGRCRFSMLHHANKYTEKYKKDG